MNKLEELHKQILQIIEGNKPNQIPQHILISGKEGTGKTFLLNEIGQKLRNKGYHTKTFLYPDSAIININDIIQGISNNEHTALLMDDIDQTFSSLSNEELYQLRAFLFRKGAPTLIASCRGLPASFTDYKAPFYDAFRVFHIPELAADDIEHLVTAEIYQQIKGKDGVQATIPLLNGNISYILQFAKEMTNTTNLQQTLDRIVKTNERYFKIKFATFPIMQQKALYSLALMGHAALSSEIAQASGLSTANTSSALYRLEKQGVIYKTSNQKRNSQYAISDFIFARWLAKGKK